MDEERYLLALTSDHTVRVRCQMCMQTADVHVHDENRWYETHTCSTPDEVDEVQA